MVARSSTVKNLRKTGAKEVSGREVNDLEQEIIARLSALKPLDTQTIRNLRREFSNRLVKTSPALIVDLALKLIRRSEFVPRFFAYELIHHHKPALLNLNAESLADLGQGIDNWGAVDTFACYLAGPSWRERNVSDALIQRLGSFERPLVETRCGRQHGGAKQQSARRPRRYQPYTNDLRNVA